MTSQGKLLKFFNTTDLSADRQHQSTSLEQNSRLFIFILNIHYHKYLSQTVVAFVTKDLNLQVRILS